VLQLHYTSNGTPGSDKTRVGLTFAKEPPTFREITMSATNNRFAIPPGDGNYQVHSEITLQADAELVNLMPHMHLRGKDITYRAIYPDGRSEILLAVPRYNFAWQVYYYPQKSLAMPKGTRIEAVAHYDNSARNALNPDPSKAVRFGEQTWDEMMNGFFDYTVDGQNIVNAAQGGPGKGYR
jgi:hypothetical protein